MKKLPFIIGILGLFVAVLGLIVFVILAGDQHPTAKPLISNLNAGPKSMTISLGSDDGVNTGDVFDVYRENKRIAEITIVKVEPDQSTANMTNIQGARKLKTGDLVIRDVTLQFLRRLRPDSAVPAPAQSGRMFAEADIKSGINRILYYGKPWSTGKTADRQGHRISSQHYCWLRGYHKLHAVRQ